MTVRPAFVYLLLGAVLVLALDAQCRPAPTGPSRDSLTIAALRHAADSAARVADSVNAANETLRARLVSRGDSTRRAVRGQSAALRAAPVPADTVTALLYWQARAKVAEVLLDLTIAADSVIQDSLSRLVVDQKRETAKLRAVVMQIRDSLGALEVRVGALSRELSGSRKPCRIGDVAGGWDPLHGGGAVVVGASCNVWRLATRAR
jgi:hypothetical protein